MKFSPRTTLLLGTATVSFVLGCSGAGAPADRCLSGMGKSAECSTARSAAQPGDNVAPDEEKSLEALAVRCEANDEGACDDLMTRADAYQAGNGIPRSPEKAWSLYMRTCLSYSLDDSSTHQDGKLAAAYQACSRLNQVPRAYRSDSCSAAIDLRTARLAVKQSEEALKLEQSKHDVAPHPSSAPSPGPESASVHTELDDVRAACSSASGPSPP